MNARAIHYPFFTWPVFTWPLSYVALLSILPCSLFIRPYHTATAGASSWPLARGAGGDAAYGGAGGDAAQGRGHGLEALAEDFNLKLEVLAEDFNLKMTMSVPSYCSFSPSDVVNNRRVLLGVDGMRV
ncbi:hypothetical protein JKP88DRAFT_332065 [Tribonema minus]|uniref:Uncharacterized protein n=1 Tax=Tribonema minus TaxID=303371 RepID=A0A835YLQ7_9STRA|nr:hypothetical protein JKP88DRAFT_332065 [Tribonema minus]